MSIFGNNEGPTCDFEFRALRWADNYRRALLREFLPCLQGTVIEIGAGIGQFTDLLCRLPQVRELLAVEPDAKFVAEFRARLPSVRVMHGTAGDLPPGTTANAIVSINVLEHIEHDLRELSSYAALLSGVRGNLCLFVPARQEIYAPLDRDFGHFRRYSRVGLSNKLRQAGLEVIRLHYYNCIGYFAWWLNFCLLRRRSFSIAAVRLFDRLVFPVGRAFETHVAYPPFGQSLLAVARAGK